MWNILKLIYLFLFAIPSCTSNSSIKVRASRPVFEFFSKAGHYLIDAEIPKIVIPNITIPINDGPGNGSVSANNLKIVKFQTPHIDFELRDNGIFWKSSGGAVKITGDWLAEYAIILPFYEDGWVKSIAVGLNVYLGASVYMIDNKPQFHIGECKAEIEDLSVEIGGGIVPWLVNLFRTPLSAALKDIINSQACIAAETIFLIQANDFIHSLPTHIPIGRNFYADYSLDGNPKFTTKYVEADISADVVYSDTKCIPKHYGEWTDAGNDPRMITVWVSQSVPNCLLRSAHRGQLVHFLVTKDIPEVENYLQTSCSLLSICIGKFFPELKKRFPKQYVDLFFHTFEDPLLIFEEGDARANVTFAVDIHIFPLKTNPKPLARLVLHSSSSVIPSISGHRIIGVLNETEVDLRQDFSTIGDMSPTFLSVFNNIFKMTTKVLVDTVLKTGIPIPILDNVTISDNSEINIFKKYIRLNIDFVLS